MSRVARAARVASRQRTETITADKTIQSAETGELYLVDQSGGAVVITLPELQEGAYFKFLIPTELTGFNTKKITIQSAGGALAGGEIVGSCLIVLDGGSTAMGANQIAKVGDNHFQFIIESTHAADDLFAGSYVDVYCDGSKWLITAELRNNQARLVGKFHG